MERVCFPVMPPALCKPTGWIVGFAKDLYRFLKRRRILDIVGYALVLFGVGWCIWRGAENQGYYWQWFRVPQYLIQSTDQGIVGGPILQGLKQTLFISGAALVLTLIIGLTAALMRLSGSRSARITSRIYLEGARNTPLLVQLYGVYFIIAPVIGIDRLAAAVLALSLFEGAYASEIFRAGIVSIDRGQWEAAHSLGLSCFNTYRRIILPQALRRILPTLTNQTISLVKDSSLVSVLAVYEMTLQANAVVSETFLVFEIYFSIAGIYLVLTAALSQLVQWMERRQALHG